MGNLVLSSPTALWLIVSFFLLILSALLITAITNQRFINQLKQRNNGESFDRDRDSGSNVQGRHEGRRVADSLEGKAHPAKKVEG